MDEDSIPPCLIFIDKEGRWFHRGAEMIHREFIRLFYENMEMDATGRTIITMGDDRCYVEVEDTPYIVRSVRFKDPGEDDKAYFQLILSDDSHDRLSPDTLYVGKEQVLYCKVKDRTFPARFSRPAYYQLAEYLSEDEGSYFLPLKGKKYVIRHEGT